MRWSARTAVRGSIEGATWRRPRRVCFAFRRCALQDITELRALLRAERTALYGECDDALLPKIIAKASTSTSTSTSTSASTSTSTSTSINPRQSRGCRLGTQGLLRTALWFPDLHLLYGLFILSK